MRSDQWFDFDDLSELVIVGKNRAAVPIATERLCRKETHRGGVGQRSQPTLLVSRTKRLAGVIEHEQLLGASGRGDRVMIRRQAEEIDWNDRLGREPALFCGRNRLAQARRIEIESIRQYIGDDWRRAKKRNHFCRRMIGEGWADHRIAGANLPCHQHKQQCIGPAGAADRMARATVGRKLSLKHVHFGALDELAMRQHARDRIVDSAAETAALRCHIDERNRPFFNSRVLIHVRPWNASADDAPRRLTSGYDGMHGARIQATDRDFKAGDRFFTRDRRRFAAADRADESKELRS